ncbi:MAG: JmjC domain-containing protein [Lysobacter sp.]
MIDFGASRETFRSTFFEQRPMYRPQAFDPSGYDWTLIDKALDLQDCSRERFKVLRQGRIAPETYVEEYVDVGLRRRRIRKDRLYKLLSDGATIVLNRIELVSQPTLDICLQVGRFAGAQATANAYASFGGDAATNVHWDTHDVFVVQMSGKKHWRLYEPTMLLPISSQTSNERKDDVPAEPAFDRVLEAGDVLYVPRGWWHRVVPVESTDTLHLAVAVHTPLVLDYLVWACASRLPEHLELRHSLLGGSIDPERVEQATEIVRAVLTDHRTLEAFYARSRSRERVVAPFNVDLLLNRRDEPLPASTQVMLNSAHTGAGEAATQVNGQPLGPIEPYQAIIRALSDTISLNVDTLRDRLPHIAPERLDALLRELALGDVIRLWEAGTPALHPCDILA